MLNHKYLDVFFEYNEHKKINNNLNISPATIDIDYNIPILNKPNDYSLILQKMNAEASLLPLFIINLNTKQRAPAYSNDYTYETNYIIDLIDTTTTPHTHHKTRLLYKPQSSPFFINNNSLPLPIKDYGDNTYQYDNNNPIFYAYSYNVLVEMINEALQRVCLFSIPGKTFPPILFKYENVSGYISLLSVMPQKTEYPQGTETEIKASDCLIYSSGVRDNINDTLKYLFETQGLSYHRYYKLYFNRDLRFFLSSFNYSITYYEEDNKQVPYYSINLEQYDIKQENLTLMPPIPTPPTPPDEYLNLQPLYFYEIKRKCILPNFVTGLILTSNNISFDSEIIPLTYFGTTYGEKTNQNIINNAEGEKVLLVLNLEAEQHSNINKQTQILYSNLNINTSDYITLTGTTPIRHINLNLYFLDNYNKIHQVYIEKGHPINTRFCLIKKNKN